MSETFLIIFNRGTIFKIYYRTWLLILYPILLVMMCLLEIEFWNGYKMAWQNADELYDELRNK